MKPNQKFFATVPRILEQPQVAIQFLRNRQRPAASSLKLSQPHIFNGSKQGMLKSLVSLFKVQV